MGSPWQSSIVMPPPIECTPVAWSMLEFMLQLFQKA